MEKNKQSQQNHKTINIVVIIKIIEALLRIYPSKCYYWMDITEEFLLHNALNLYYRYILS